MTRPISLGLLFAAILTACSIARADDQAEIARRANLMQLQNRVQAFRTMDTAYPYNVIKRGGPVAELPRAPRRLDVTYTVAGRSHTLDDLLTRTRTQGFLVIKGGNIIDERYFNGADDKTKFTSWSVGKSFTSTLIGLALADGKLKSIDDPVTDYLPQLKGSGYDNVPIKDILQMSSGVKFTEVYSNTESDVSIMWRKTMIERSESLSSYAQSLGRSEIPGSKFVYRSIDTAVLGMLARSVTGKSLADMLSERIWQPLGMENDATWLTDKDGLEAGYCCINATLRDYARFGLLFLHHGKVGDSRLVPASWVDAATNPQSAQVQYGRIQPGDPGGYGYQWWLMEPGTPHPYSAEGVFFQFVYVSPKYDMVIVKTSAYDDFWSDSAQVEQFAAFDAIGAALSKN